MEATGREGSSPGTGGLPAGSGGRRKQVVRKESTGERINDILEVRSAVLVASLVSSD